MESSGLVLDTSNLIDFLRKSNKNKSQLFRLSDQYELIASVITQFEVEVGLKPKQYSAYQDLLNQITYVPVDSECIGQALQTEKYLKVINQRIALADLLIGATALAYRLPIATLNIKHFNRIPYLQIVTLPQ